MGSIHKRVKSTLIDIAGILLIALAGLTGWLPGPGGIPLLIAGLGLLSINHDWAKRWLMSVKDHGVNLSDKLFNGSPKMALLIDVVGLAFITIAVIIVFTVTQNIVKSAAIWLTIIAIVLLLGNRKRLSRFRKKH